MHTQVTDLSHEDRAEAIVELIESTGLAYIHSSGCAVLKDGTWLQPEQWDMWLKHLEEGECEAC
ncbi:hypothetical protein BKP64_10770 [Marinobacter salinus]|uniref:Uncharacterized protein n=1 Tax=Marinobacter salinus TaxID=1874317 RepID=A0A1D9GMI7_9GAMM|nr:hypothetical protein [Marinobacter salinus]AOY88610.1 hypothetical protein BKP64_10770 [Marinobacter salinus]